MTDIEVFHVIHTAATIISLYGVAKAITDSDNLDIRTEKNRTKIDKYYAYLLELSTDIEEIKGELRDARKKEVSRTETEDRKRASELAPESAFSREPRG